ncbi:tetratricopeptide repeat protein [Primorskyibacter sp. S187A]|uniref:tetratricopeptide repeat protein n=1 Tax=Primorskyibacter sp. S187A TaxID=3415130 RepID=UPI003C7BC1FC
MIFRPVAAFAPILGLILSLTTPPASAGVSGPYLAARHASFNTDFRSAVRYYELAFAEDRSSAPLMEAVTASHMSLGGFERAGLFADELIKKGFESQVAHMARMAVAARDEEFDLLIERLEAGEDVGPLVDGLALGWAELGRGDMTASLAAFDAVGEQRGLRGFADYHKALALASVGDFESAVALLEGEFGAAQATRRAVMAHAMILSQLDRNDDAVALLNDMFTTRLDPGLAALRDALEAGETVPFTTITSPRDGMAEVFYTIAIALEGEAANDYTLLYTRVAEFLREDHVDAILLSARLLEQLDEFELATEAYEHVPLDHPAYHAAAMGRAAAMREGGDVEGAILALRTLAASHEGLPTVHTTLGDILRQEKRFEEAVEAYDRSIEIYGTPASRGQWFVYFARAISHERLDNWPLAEADFRKALELNPDQPQVLNYLGYSLVEKKIKLDEALDMIERAVAARPDSGYIVDSLGWVLFRLGRYEEAVPHMERATELMPIDPVVNDHLGDVYWAVGRKLEARFQWNRALSFIDRDDHGEADPERIRRKLEVGLDQVLAEDGLPPLQVANSE